MKRKLAKLQLAVLIASIFGMAFCMNQVFWSDVTRTTRIVYGVISVLLYVLILLMPLISMRLRGKQITFKKYVRWLVCGTGDRAVSYPFFSGYERDEAFPQETDLSPVPPGWV